MTNQPKPSTLKPQVPIAKPITKYKNNLFKTKEVQDKIKSWLK